MFALLGVSVCSAALAVLVSACSAAVPVQAVDSDTMGTERATEYSIICVIHGDGDYLYHDTSGTEYRADEEALAEARRIGQHNPRAEVFIFHQKPRRHMLFLFPLHDGDFSYYLHGRLVAEESYWRDQEDSPWAVERALYRRFHAEGLVVSRIPGASHCAREGELIREHVHARLGLPTLELEIPSCSDSMLPTSSSRLGALVEAARGRRPAY